MTTRQLIYNLTIITIVSLFFIPCMMLLSGSVLGSMGGLCYCFLMWYILRCTSRGKWLLREWWRSTLRLERYVLGENS